MVDPELDPGFVGPEMCIYGMPYLRKTIETVYICKFYTSTWPCEHITRVPLKALEGTYASDESWSFDFI